MYLPNSNSVNNSNNTSLYNIMDDDLDNDLQIEINIMPDNSEQDPITIDSFLTERLQNRLYHLQGQSPELEIDSEYYLQGPSSISSNSSKTNSNYNNSSLHSEQDTKKSNRSNRSTYRKLTYEEVEYSIQNHLHREKYGTELDILITFMKGQKHIYLQSYHLTRFKVFLLIFPSLLITGCLTVLSPIISSYPWNGYLLSALNAILTLLIAALNFWNLQFNMLQYNSHAGHFDRLETSLIMIRNQTALLQNGQEKTNLVLQKIKDTESRMLEMKETFTIMVPIEIQSQVPFISHFDIFAFIQKIDQHMKMLILQYKDVKNEIRYIMYKWKTKHIPDHATVDSGLKTENDSIREMYYRDMIVSSNKTESKNETETETQKETERQRLDFLLKQKEKIKSEIFQNQKQYMSIENLFVREIQHSEYNQNYIWFLCCYCWFRPKISDLKSSSNENLSILESCKTKYT